MKIHDSLLLNNKELPVLLVEFGLHPSWAVLLNIVHFGVLVDLLAFLD